MLEPLSPVMIPLMTVNDQLQRGMQAPVLAPLHVPSKVSNDGPNSRLRLLTIFATGTGATGGRTTGCGCGTGAATDRVGLATFGGTFIDGPPWDPETDLSSFPNVPPVAPA